MVKPFSILILLAILSQEIFALLEEDEQSSNILLRMKRVLHPANRRQHPPPNHAVSILKDGELFCGGVILSRDIILTAAHCIHTAANYSILSDSKKRSNSVFHAIKYAETHPMFDPNTLAHNIALLIIIPIISFRERGFNREISIHPGPIRTGTVGIFSGWGSTTLAREPNTIYPDIVQSIDVHIMNWQDCAATYGNEHTHITSYEICTYDPEGRKRSGYGDAGGGLTVDGQLVGILSWSRVVVNRHTPDVYINVALPIYKRWIDEFKVVRIRRLRV